MRFAGPARHGAGGGEAVVGDVADRGRAEGREGEADADAGEDRAGQPEADVVVVGESPGGFLVSGERATLEQLGAVLLGEVGGDAVKIGAGDRSLTVSLADAERAWRSLAVTLDAEA